MNVPVVSTAVSSVNTVEIGMVASAIENDHIFISSTNNADYIDNICGGIEDENLSTDGINSTWITRNSHGEIEENRNSDEINRRDLEKSLECFCNDQNNENSQELSRYSASDVASGNVFHDFVFILT